MRSKSNFLYGFLSSFYKIAIITQRDKENAQ